MKIKLNSHFKSIYVAGTIGSFAVTPAIFKRFNSLQSSLEKMGFTVFNPIRGKQIGENLYYSNEIVHRDERDIDKSDLLIATIPGDTISIGTPMEIYRAREICKIPVIVVSPSKFVRNHYWILSKATKIFTTQWEALNYIAEWYT